MCGGDDFSEGEKEPSDRNTQAASAVRPRKNSGGTGRRPPRLESRPRPGPPDEGGEGVMRRAQHPVVDPPAPSPDPRPRTPRGGIREGGGTTGTNVDDEAAPAKSKAPVRSHTAEPTRIPPLARPSPRGGRAIGHSGGRRGSPSRIPSPPDRSPTLAAKCVNFPVRDKSPPTASSPPPWELGPSGGGEPWAATGRDWLWSRTS